MWNAIDRVANARLQLLLCESIRLNEAMSEIDHLIGIELLQA